MLLMGTTAERYRVYNAEYYAQNRERELARVKAQYWADPETARARARERYAEWASRQSERDIEARRHRIRTKTAVEAGAPVVDLTLDEWLEVKAEHDGRCAYCGTAGAIEQDHVWPLSRGGSHTRDNVALACRRCNSSKRASLLAEWLGFVA